MDRELNKIVVYSPPKFLVLILGVVAPAAVLLGMSIPYFRGSINGDVLAEQYKTRIPWAIFWMLIVFSWAKKISLSDYGVVIKRWLPIWSVKAIPYYSIRELAFFEAKIKRASIKTLGIKLVDEPTIRLDMPEGEVGELFIRTLQERIDQPPEEEEEEENEESRYPERKDI